MNKEIYKSWHSKMKPTRVIKKNTIVKGRGKTILTVNITDCYWSGENGKWVVVKYRNQYRAINLTTHCVIEAPHIKTIYKMLDTIRRDSNQRFYQRTLIENTCKWDDDPFDDFSVRPLYAYGDIEPECEP